MAHSCAVETGSTGRSALSIIPPPLTDGTSGNHRRLETRVDCPLLSVVDPSILNNRLGLHCFRFCHDLRKMPGETERSSLKVLVWDGNNVVGPPGLGPLLSKSNSKRGAFAKIY